MSAHQLDDQVDGWACVCGWTGRNLRAVRGHVTRENRREAAEAPEQLRRRRHHPSCPCRHGAHDQECRGCGS